MGTKSKNRCRIVITIVGIIVIAIGTLAFFPNIEEQAAGIEEEWSRQADAEDVEVDEDVVRDLYRGCYVLYLEQLQKEQYVTAADVFLDGYDTAAEEAADAILQNWGSEFENNLWNLDYCVCRDGSDYEKNTDKPLEEAGDYQNAKDKETLEESYSDFFIVNFDANGNLSIEPVYNSQLQSDTLIKAFQHVDRENLLENAFAEWGVDETVYRVRAPQNFTVIYGIWRDNGISLGNDWNTNVNDYWVWISAYEQAGGVLLFAGGLAVVAAFLFFTTSRKIWGDGVWVKRPGKMYLMEAAVIGAVCTVAMEEAFVGLISNYTYYDQGLQVFTQHAALDAVEELTGMFLCVVFIYALWYLSLRFLRPVFSLGLREYVRQYSLIYQIFPWLKKMWGKIKGKWAKLEDEVCHIDFSQKSTKTIIKIVAINFIVLAICSCMWFFGIGALLVYSVVLFFLIKKYYDKAGRDYQALMRGISCMAEGDLETEITEDLGIFEPFKVQIASVRSGFKKAVDEEVKSQRMKADLITNVSHDLKTPLTAITTYVELLKKDDITEEERRSYIDTLDKKAQRLKVLIEDLFEVSKATSNNIVLHPIEVDVANLLKQVAVEHAEKFDELGLTLRWDLPDGKVILMLDNQKTFRIFENLFSNIRKYAMPGSRVYVAVKKAGGVAEITLKNMSATELNFDPEEITERFVRGDASRNTEGSGLGLAIAKSFTEAQGGSFRIDVDGDLFKVTIGFKA